MPPRAGAGLAGAPPVTGLEVPTPELRSSRGGSRYALLLLFVVGAFNLMDRQILAVLLEPIRLEFGVSDTAMGVLTGFAFVLFYSFATLPIARLADVRSRKLIITAGLTFWTGMTAVSGFATSFWQLALARVGVGIGEASHIPAGMSMVSDHFPPERRTLALAVFSLSAPIGMMLALVAGGVLGGAIGWRGTLMVLGAAGFVLALIVGLTLKEPSRGGVDGADVDRSVHDVRATLSYLWSLRSLRHLAMGAALSMFAGMALRTWSPAFLMRVHGLDLTQTGVSLGPAVGLGGIVGVLGAGAVAQRLSRRDARWLTWVPALTQTLGLPFIALFLLLPSAGSAIPMYFGVAMFGVANLGPTMAAVQGLAKVRMRALAAASVSFLVNMIGLGAGPFVAGALSDALQPAFGVESLRYALMVTGTVAVWSAAHYVLAARSLRADLDRSAAQPGSSGTSAM